MPRYFQNRLEFAPAFRSGKQATRREEVCAARMLLFVPEEQPDTPLPFFVTVAARANDESAASHAAAIQAGGDLLAWIERYCKERYKTIPDLLRAAVGQANRKIGEDKQMRGAATTAGASLALAALVKQGKDDLRLYGAHVGVGRVYLVRQAKVYLLTTDHSTVRMYVDGGYMDWAEAVKQPNRTELKRFLGKQRSEEGDSNLISPEGRAPWDPDKPVPVQPVQSIALQKNDQVWLVTPAPYDRLTSAQLQDMVNVSPARTANGLVKLVSTNGAGAAAAVVRWRDRNWGWVFYLLAALLLLAIIGVGVTPWLCRQGFSPVQVCRFVEIAGEKLSDLVELISEAATPTITSTATITPTQTPVPPSPPATTETALASPITAAPPPTPSPTPTATRTLTPRPTNTATVTPMPTSTFLPPATFTLTSTFTPTPVPATATPILPTPTPGLTATATPQVGDLATTTPTDNEAPALTITVTATISVTSVPQPMRPALLPDRSTLSAVVGEKVTFEWRHNNQLAPDLGFELRIWQAGEYHAGAYDALKTADEVRCENGICKLTIGWSEGDYQWAVAVVQIKPYSRELFDLESQPPGTLRIAAPSRPQQEQSNCNSDIADDCTSS